MDDHVSLDCYSRFGPGLLCALFYLAWHFQDAVLDPIRSVTGVDCGWALSVQLEKTRSNAALAGFRSAPHTWLGRGVKGPA